MKRLKLVIGGTALVLVLLGVLVASRSPDGLERVAVSLGFASRGSAVSGSPFAAYETRGVHSRWVAQASAGLVGVALLYGFGVLFGKAVKRRK